MTWRQLQARVNEIASYADERMDDEAIVFNKTEDTYDAVKSIKAAGDHYDRPVDEGQYIIIV